ncbi:LysR family transcriptional regulator [Geobacter sulfurreducens]|uniref:LysR family transcriptional regulator n=1 Tax=Geobacter sulfurreducens TaxID=35554 RepID=UPI002CBB36A1|nr:LysR family transcriptional regulator [Geobacter sulfurreducens]HML77527.1 LysR family transcriptional regulator [Geobacter sulfurreducens]
MDIRQLQFFVAIVRHGSFTRAAERLRVAQPAVSMAMKRLEEELDLVLFNRQERKVSLTAEGEIFLRHAEKILEEVTSTEAEMEELRGLAKGEVRVGIPPMMSAYFFPQIIRDFSTRYPELHLSVSGEGASKIQKMILDGELDMGVIAGASFPDTLELRRFLREEVIVCVPKNHPLAEMECLPLQEFARHPLIFYKEGYYLRELVFDVMRGVGLNPAIRFETNLYTLVKSLIRKGMGISVFLRMVVEEDDDLKAIPLDPPLYLDLQIAWKKYGYLSRANRAFVDFLLEQRARVHQPAGSCPVRLVPAD